MARGYTKALERARRLVYIEDQYLWGHHVGNVFTEALRDNPDLQVVAVVPLFPDLDGASRLPQLLGRRRAMLEMMQAAPDRVAIYGIENHAGTPVYVHAKVCVIDDTWATHRLGQLQPAVLDPRLRAVRGRRRRTATGVRPPTLRLDAGCRAPRPADAVGDRAAARGDGGLRGPVRDVRRLRARG